MTRLCIDNNLRKKMGAAAYKASALYAIERTTKMMIASYENIIKNAPPHDDEPDLSLRKIMERILP